MLVFIIEVNVIGETSIQFSTTNETQSFYWKGYGLKFHIPQASLPDGVNHSRVTIEASLAGQYKFPDNTTLVSAVYWINSPLKFLQPITLEIQHCAKQTNGSTLSFAMACTQDDGRYLFKPLQGGIFNSSYSYGSIKLKHFCGIAVIQNDTEEQSYCGRLYYLGNRADWRIFFVIIKDLEAAITVSSNTCI